MNKKYFLYPLIYFFADQLTKYLVVSSIPYQSYIKLTDWFNIVNVSNTGVAFSLFQNNNIFFIILTVLIISGVIFFVKRNINNMSKTEVHSMLLVVAGGIGNLTDRIFRGAVVDFIDIGYKDVYRWPSFNVADSCVCIGVTLFIIANLFCSKKSN